MILGKKVYNKSLLIFDGDCGICTKLALYAERKVIGKSQVKPFYEVLEEVAEFGINSELAAKTVIYIRNNEVFLKSRAVFEFCKIMPGIYKIPGILFSNNFFTLIFNPFYNLIANNRAKISKFLGYDACKLRF